ncbi:hypothetical protein BOTNAR_0499g00010 [Botryotinia narcissicola]|uniref:Uncharacterized protein n=1 Tax=Botryotinia narcissicola TaxID=278944 RepID=A0A4Z1HL31_9HELO|nr:hypothetical protein BOTNAR_0499g00010 [Botryotinia narcissicola]
MPSISTIELKVEAEKRSRFFTTVLDFLCFEFVDNLISVTSSDRQLTDCNKVIVYIWRQRQVIDETEIRIIDAKTYMRGVTTSGLFAAEEEKTWWIENLLASRMQRAN